MIALVQLGYRPTNQKTWPYRCTNCQATSRDMHLPLDRHHHDDCRWLKAWNRVPEFVHHFFLECGKSLDQDKQFELREL